LGRAGPHSGGIDKAIAHFFPQLPVFAPTYQIIAIIVITLFIYFFYAISHRPNSWEQRAIGRLPLGPPLAWPSAAARMVRRNAASRLMGGFEFRKLRGNRARDKISRNGGLL
jgi:hypothetical protein